MVDQAKQLCEVWLKSTPLERLKITLDVPDRLNTPRFVRTEQRGVTLLLKAVPEEIRKELISAREITSTGVCRLLVTHQPGGPPGSSLSDRLPEASFLQVSLCKGSAISVATWTWVSAFSLLFEVAAVAASSGKAQLALQTPLPAPPALQTSLLPSDHALLSRTLPPPATSLPLPSNPPSRRRGTSVAAPILAAFCMPS